MAVIAVLGGTGNEGRGLATRWARSGHTVIIGSRDAARAAAAAAEINEANGIDNARGDENAAAATSAEIVVLAVPYEVQIKTLESVKGGLTGKILVDVTVPLNPPRVARVQLPPGGSATVAAQELLGDDVHVVAAFQNVSAHLLEDPEAVVDCDVLVCGDKRADRDVVVGLVEDAGMRGLHAGSLANAAAAEAMTSVLIFMNRFYESPGAGVRITEIPDQPPKKPN